jgi:CheY-like chemotaxis protein
VLVVDDEPALRALYCEFLRWDGHRAEAAGSGKAALSKFRAADFDLVITDQSMADMNGRELSEELKRLKPEVPVFLLTGMVDQTRPARSSPTIDLLLAKPISHEAFQRAVASL